jgi:hypothetical protein
VTGRQHTLDRQGVAKPVPLLDARHRAFEHHVLQLAPHDGERRQGGAGLEQSSEVAQWANGDQGVGPRLIERLGQGLHTPRRIWVVVDPQPRRRVVDESPPLVTEHHARAPGRQGLAQTAQYGDVRALASFQQLPHDAATQLHIAKDRRDADQFERRVLPGVRKSQGVIDVGTDVCVDPDSQGSFSRRACDRAGEQASSIASHKKNCTKVLLIGV